jgi:hypothetical protein
MISEVTEEAIRGAWAAAIPPRYRHRPDAALRGQDGHVGAIIAAPAPPALLAAFPAAIVPHARIRQPHKKRGSHDFARAL